MYGSIKLGRLFGIPIALHYSWFVIATLITLSLLNQFRVTNPAWTATTAWTVALVTAALFFVSLTLHELSHALVARARRLTVKSITLFALGGVAQIEKEAESPRTEFWVAIAGPLLSLTLGFLFLSIAQQMGWTLERGGATPMAAMLGWLGSINIALALFNLIPGFPLDGGRILRAIVWWVTGDMARSTRIVARIGQAVAFGFIAIGLMRFFSGADGGGLWLAFIGWFLLEAAQAGYLQVVLVSGLRDVHVRDVMDREVMFVNADTDLQTFVDDYLLRSGRRCFMVKRNGTVVGLMTPHEAKHVDRQRWPETKVANAMRPFKDVRTVTPGMLATDALSLMGRDDLNQLPVVSKGHVEGVISRGDILGLFRTRAELRV